MKLSEDIRDYQWWAESAPANAENEPPYERWATKATELEAAANAASPRLRGLLAQGFFGALDQKNIRGLRLASNVLALATSLNAVEARDVAFWEEGVKASL